MNKRRFKHYQTSLLAILFAVVVVLTLSGVATATGKVASATTDLSNTNWDEEGDSEAESGIDGNNLASESWEDEEGDEQVDGADDLQALNQDDINKLESRERFIHIMGFILFIGYILGGIATAFVTRNRKIATLLPPELLILLHSVWPLELLLTPLFGKASR